MLLRVHDLSSWPGIRRAHIGGCAQDTREPRNRGYRHLAKMGRSDLLPSKRQLQNSALKVRKMRKASLLPKPLHFVSRGREASSVNSAQKHSLKPGQATAHRCTDFYLPLPRPPQSPGKYFLPHHSIRGLSEPLRARRGRAGQECGPFTEEETDRKHLSGAFQRSAEKPQHLEWGLPARVGAPKIFAE